MSLGLNDKLGRMLTFLVGVREPLVFAQLGTRGFTNLTLREGWEHFTTAAGAKLDLTLPADVVRTDMEARAALGELDTWENTWFPLISVSLQRHHPEVHAAVFENLNQTEGREVILSVGTLLKRLDALSNEPKGAQALELLESRGFTPAVRRTAENLLEMLQREGEAKAALLPNPTLEEQQQALDAAWGWYVEWSTIARTVITRGDLLVRLGLRKPKRKKASRKSSEAKSEAPA